VNIFLPVFAGRVGIRTPEALFLQEMKARIESGLLTGRPHRRSRYAVIRQSQREIAFAAADFTTAISVGLNEVVLRVAGERSVEYSVRYGKWAAYVVGLGACLCIAFLCVFLIWDIEAEFRRYAFVADPAMSRAIGLALFWGIALFWTLVWPWILIAMHRPFARRLLEQIIREVDAAAGSANSAGR
jgi:hypothetical protein